MKGWIYKITNKKNGKIYIGQTIVGIDKRWRQHVADSRNKRSKFYKAINKYGASNFIVEEVECIEVNFNSYNKNREEISIKLDRRERYWIAKYDSYKTGYNSTKGGCYVNVQENKEGENLNMNNEKYYTQVEVAEILGLTTTTINSYVKELTKEEKRGKFNRYNRPNEEGLDLLKKKWHEKNPNKKLAKDEIAELKEKLEDKEQKIKELEEEKEKLYAKILDFTDKFSQIADQQQKINITKENSSDIDFDDAGFVSENPKKKKSLFERLFYRKK